MRPFFSSRRQWDGLVKHWKRGIHLFNNKSDNSKTSDENAAAAANFSWAEEMEAEAEKKKEEEGASSAAGEDAAMASQGEEDEDWGNVQDVSFGDYEVVTTTGEGLRPEQQQSPKPVPNSCSLLLKQSLAMAIVAMLALFGALYFWYQ